MAYTTGTAATAAAAHLNRTYEGPYLIRSCPAGHLSYLRCIRRTRWQGDIFTTICQTNVKKARDTYCWSWYYRTGRGRTAMLLRRRSVLVTEQQRFRHRCVPTAFSPPPALFSWCPQSNLLLLLLLAQFTDWQKLLVEPEKGLSWSGRCMTYGVFFNLWGENRNDGGIKEQRESVCIYNARTHPANLWRIGASNILWQLHPLTVCCIK